MKKWVTKCKENYVLSTYPEIKCKGWSFPLYLADNLLDIYLTRMVRESVLGDSPDLNLHL